jgi:hypothetical protein
MSKRKSGGHAAESPSPPEIVCILVVDAIPDEFEVELCCQRTDGVDRVFRPPWTGCVLKDQAKNLTDQLGTVPYADGGFSSNLPTRADCRTG